MNKHPARMFTALAGILLLLQGASTLLFRLIPSLDRAFPALLAVTQMIPVHSALHIVTGIVALSIFYRGGERDALWFTWGFSVFYLTLGLAGLLSGHTLGLGLQPFDHPVHIMLGLLGFFAAYLSSSRKVST